jgi:hypothetical protein
MSNLSVSLGDLNNYLATLTADVSFPVLVSEEGQAYVRVAINLPEAVDPIVPAGPALATLGEVTPAQQVTPVNNAQETNTTDVVIEAGSIGGEPQPLGDVVTAAEGTVETYPVTDASSDLGDCRVTAPAGLDKENA